MEVRTFRAESLQEALQMVRESLGPDASVLHTRQVKRSTLGLFAKRMIEVDASNGMQVVSRFTLRDSTESSRQYSASRPSQAELESVHELEHDEPSIASQLLAKEQPQAQQTLEPNAQSTTTGHTHSEDSARKAMEVSESSHQSPAANRLPAAAAQTFTAMLKSGIEPVLARRLLQEACQRCDQEFLDDPWLIQGQVLQVLATRLQTSGAIEIPTDEQRIVAVVGPTGVGKTTILAKIAAGFRFDLGCQVGLITLDTQRRGAVDQLLNYAELISAPLEVVSSPEQVIPALQRLRECDLVLLDSTGLSPRDTEQLGLLGEFLQVADPDYVQLVLSATSSSSHAQNTLEAFSILNPTHVAITKLDEAVGFGEWASLLQSLSLPVNYLTSGQEVPSDLSVANSRRLASLLLGNPGRVQPTVDTK